MPPYAYLAFGTVPLTLAQSGMFMRIFMCMCMCMAMGSGVRWFSELRKAISRAFR